MKNFIAKIRYLLALIVIVLTISNVTLLSNQFKSLEGIHTSISSIGEWQIETN